MTKIAAFTVTIVVPMLAKYWLGRGNKALVSVFDGLNGGNGAAVYLLFLPHTARVNAASRKLPHIGGETV